MENIRKSGQCVTAFFLLQTQVYFFFSCLSSLLKTPVFWHFFLCAMVAERSPLHTKGYDRRVKPSQLLPPAHDWHEIAEHRELMVMPIEKLCSNKYGIFSAGAQQGSKH